jgi:tetratricopeptide (TPR) repeat protein
MHGAEFEMCFEIRTACSRGEGMKKAATILVAFLGVCAWSFGQSGDKPATQTPAAGQAAAPAAAPQGKRPAQAKTQPEFQAYKEALALTDAAATEKAADNFATSYPDSELRVVIYKSAMQKYQVARNSDKGLEMARKALTYDPDDPEPLLGAAEVLLESTHDADLDNDQKLAEAKKNAERALVTVDTDVPTSGYAPDQLAAFKGYTRSEAYVILGTLAFNARNWTEAESNLRKSIDAFPQQPDPIAVFRLAVALDMQGKYAEGLKFVDQAVDLTKDQPDSAAGKAARDEKDRLTKLNMGTAPGQPAKK